VEEREAQYDDIGDIKTFMYYPPAPEPFALFSNSKPPAVFIDTLRSEVSKEYCQVAQNPELGFHFHTGRRLTQPCWNTKTIGYKACRKRP